jgi:hypothetical protein
VKSPTYFQRAAGVRAAMRYVTPLHPFARAARANESDSVASAASLSATATREPVAGDPAETIVRASAIAPSEPATPKATPADRGSSTSVAAWESPPSTTSARGPTSDEETRRELAPPEKGPEPLNQHPVPESGAPIAMEKSEPAARRPSARGTARRGGVTITTNSAGTTSYEAPRKAGNTGRTDALAPRTERSSATTPESAPRERAARERAPESEPSHAPAIAVPPPRSGSRLSAAAPQPVDRGVHIGSIEVRVVAPPPETAPGPAAPAASAPLSRGFASAIGLRQS